MSANDYTKGPGLHAARNMVCTASETGAVAIGRAYDPQESEAITTTAEADANARLWALAPRLVIALRNCASLLTEFHNEEMRSSEEWDKLPYPELIEADDLLGELEDIPPCESE